MPAVFTDREIREAIETGQIVIDPYVPENVRGSSVDVRLGSTFYRVEGPEVSDALNPFDEESTQRFFKEPFSAMPNAEWCERHGRVPWRGIPHDHPIVVLRPHERILAHTIESIGIVYNGTTKMQARSSWGRCGIVVCKDAGWGDPGYTSRWTMEIQNDNNVLVPLPVGVRIAQIVFYHMARADRSYGDDGKYQPGSDTTEAQRLWTPSMMLPRLYEDVEELSKGDG